jgi:E3 SUMO-protein ligase NSE2
MLLLESLIKFLAEEGDVSDDEDDIMVGGVVQDFKCPLTLTMLTDPLTS